MTGPMPARFDPREVEAGTRAFWTARGLPSATGIVGAGSGPLTHEIVGTVYPAEGLLTELERPVRADADARFLALVGRRARGTTRILPAPRDEDPTTQDFAAAGLWAGGRGSRPYDADFRHEEVARGVGRLARDRVLISVDAPFRTCPACRTPRSPEAILYQRDPGTAYLVRFPLRGATPPTFLLVWADTCWKLLGTTAVLVNPDQAYVVAEYHRHGVTERIVTSKSSVDRIRDWLPDSELKILEERPGKTFAGASYDHPLAVEFPSVATLTPPGATIVASPEIGDSGTGLVALVPAHGGSDSVLADSLGIPGWPLVGNEGTFHRGFTHKYSGLPLGTAEEFVLRDLLESGAVFAELRVVRSAPHCLLCGTPLIWQPSRAWCLDPNRLRPDLLRIFQSAVPGDPLLRSTEVVPWPVSEDSPSQSPTAPQLYECSTCNRLDPPEAGPKCPCGSARTLVRRELLGAVREALASWVSSSALTRGDPVRIYLPQRRRGPMLVHLLLGLHAFDLWPGDIRVTVTPTLPNPSELVLPDEPLPWDAIRSALLRIEAPPRNGRVLLDRIEQENRRLRRIWEVAREVLALVPPADDAAADDIRGYLTELLPEDRGFLATFEKLRVEVRELYEKGAFAAAHARLIRFFERAFHAEYLPLARRRFAPSSSNTDRLSAARTLRRLLDLWNQMFAPIAPFASEQLHRAIHGDARSVFELPWSPAEDALIVPADAELYRQWQSIVASVGKFRRQSRCPWSEVLPLVVVSVDDEPLGGLLRDQSATLRRMLNAVVVEVASPLRPWVGKKVEARPVPSEIQRVYPADAGLIITLLNSRPPGGLEKEIRHRTLSVTVQARAVEILPTMIELTETIPPGVVPIPWRGGELFVGLPESSPSSVEAARLPPLSHDEYHLVRAIHRRLLERPDSVRQAPVAVFGDAAVRREVERHANGIARALNLSRIDVVDDPAGFLPNETIVGRTRRGHRWKVWLPGAISAPRARKRQTKAVARPRVRPRLAPGSLAPPIPDFLSDEAVQRNQAQREMAGRLDAAVGLPIVGPAKASLAWDAGFDSLEAFGTSSFETLAAVPGFGPIVTEEIQRRLVPGQHRILRPRPAVLPTDSKARPVAISGPEDVALVPHAPTIAESQPEAQVPSERREEPAPEPPVTPNVSDGPSPELAVLLRFPSAPVEEGGPVDSHDGIDKGVPGSPRLESEAAPPTSTPTLESESPPLASESTLPPESDAAPEDTAEVPAPPLEPTTVSLPDEPAPVSEEPAEPLTLPEESPTAPESPAIPTREVVPMPVVGEASEAPPEAPPSESILPELMTEEPGPQPSPPPPPPGVETPSGEPLSLVVPSAESRPAEAPPAGEPPAELVAPEPRPPAVEFSPPEFPLPAQAPAPPLIPALETAPPPIEPPSPPLEVTPAVEPEAAAPSPPPISPSAPPRPPSFGVELFLGGALDVAWRRFLDATGAGVRGLCVSREFPERLRGYLGNRDVEIVWLANVGRGRTARPSDLPALVELFRSAIADQRVEVIFFEGVEYLLRLHGFDRTVAVVRELDQMALEGDIRIWIPIRAELLSPSDLERLRSGFPGSDGSR